MGQHIDRDALYAAVWAEPATTVAARFGVTSTMLAKICRKLRVPTPPRGYWARKAAGQRVAPAKLPKLERGQRTSHTFAYGAQPCPPECAAVTAERARGSIAVPADLSMLHPMVRKYEARLRRRGEQSDLWSRIECLAIDVSKEQLDRALRIMSGLLVALDERGMTFEVTPPTGERDDQRSKTIVVVDAQRLHFGLYEDRRWDTPVPASTPSAPQPDRDAWKRIRDPKKRATAYAAALLSDRPRLTPTYPRPTQKVWTGELRLWMSPVEMTWHSWGQLQFGDTPTQRLEERLHKFVIQLHVVAEKIRALREEHARLAEQRAEEERIRAQRERERARQERLVGDLADRIETLREAAEIRALADRIATREPATPSTVSWLAWARARAAAIESVALDVAHAWETA